MRIAKNLLNKLFILASTSLVFTAPAQAIPIMTDIISIVDESGSMGGEHAWIGGMINSLDAALASAAGTDPFSAQYGLVGFSGHSTTPHQHRIGASGTVTPGVHQPAYEFGTAAQFNAATSGLTLSGGTEDGYAGIDFGLDYSFRTGTVKNLILVTDEDRDNTNGALTNASIAAALDTHNALLNAVLNVSFRCGDNSIALGMISGGIGYKADGAGGFSTCTGAHAVSGNGNSIAHYVGLALNSGGAAWDLNQLRAGGLTATSFTAAFIDIKVQEIVVQSTPEPLTMALMGLGLLGLGVRRRNSRLAV